MLVFFEILETFCKQVLQNKNHGSIVSIVFGPMDQRFWRNKVFEGSLKWACRC
jgi:hypothetical protein